MPTYQNRSAQLHPVGARQKLVLSTAQYAALERVATAQKISLFAVLTASVKTLLYHLTGQEDLIVGTTIAGRQRAELAGQIGFYVNTLPLRTQVHGQRDFHSLARRVHDSLQAAFEHRDFPFDELVDLLDLSRDTGRTPLFDVLVEQLSADLDAPHPQLPGVQLEGLELGSTSAKFDLAIRFIDNEEERSLYLEYNASLFRATQVERWLGWYQKLLDQVVREEVQSLARIDLIGEKEQQQLLDWGTTLSTDTRAFRSIAQAFEAVVARQPAAPALRYGEQSYTYAQVNQAANRLAQQLLTQHTVTSDRLVAVLTDRSPALLVALLGILKSGAAFLPLDPQWPEARLRLILEEAGVDLLLTDTMRMFDVTLFYQGGMALLEDEISGDSDLANPTVAIAAEDLAYVLYTSGSTGKPKGVAISQGSIHHYLSWANRYYFAGANYPMPWFTSVAFDLTLTSIFSTLLRGDTLWIRPANEAIEDSLHAIFTPSTAIRAVKMTPAHASLLALLPLEQSPVQRVILGGEALPATAVTTLRRLNAEVQLYNEYGPTEATVGCTVQEVLTADDINIGRPIEGAEIYLLNPERAFCPPGVQGELYIGGPGLARAYYRRPDLTMERFVEVDIPGRGPRRLYRTGDVARWTEAGALEYGGRVDEQVKVRGYRIELGEVENFIQGLAGVRQAVVLAPQVAGERQLQAFVQLERPELKWEDLKKQLATQLPNYMLPNNGVILEKFPLTVNGKVDRAALRQRGLTAGDQSRVAPRTDLERSWVARGEMVLEKNDLGICDNFFELGGHSLKAIQLTLAIQEKMGLKLDIQDIFNAPTIEQLAVRIEASERQMSPELVAHPNQTHYPLSDAQRRLWVINQFEETLPSYNMHTAFKIAGVLDESALEKSIRSLIERHESLRTSFDLIDGEPRQKIADPGAWPLPLASVDYGPAPDASAQLARYARQLASQPFDLAQGPLHRWRLVRYGTDEQVLILVIHHIISDGWTMELLTKELLTFYRAYSRQQPHLLPELQLQYRDFAIWQRQLLGAETESAHQQYWHQVFAGELPILQIPLDYPRPALKTYASDSIDFVLSSELTESLHQLAQREGTSPFSALFAAVVALMYRYSGQEDLILGTPVAGRDHFALRTMAGLFLNTLPIRSSLSAERSFIDLLRQTSQTLLAADQHQSYPFDRLVDDLQLSRDTSRSPLFDVLVVSTDFDLVGHRNEEPEQLDIEYYAIDKSANKYDLTFYFGKHENHIHVNLAYNTSLFKPERIERMRRHFQALLGALLEAPERAVGASAYLDPAEYQRWVLDFNATTIDYAREATLHQLFEQRAARQPEATALRQHGRSLHYGALNAAANRLAHHLRSLGVQNGQNIGLLVDRNFKMIIGMLGILKAGGTYVPIDPAYPEDRCRYLIENSEIDILLSDQDLEAAQLPATIQVVPLAEDGFGDHSEENLDLPISSRQLAYIIYTSGSTGRPKGVMIQHHSAVNLLSWVNRRFAVDERDRMLLLTSMCFDLSVYDIFGMLAAGGSIVIAEYEQIRDYRALQQLLTEESVTFWDTVPTTMDYLVSELERYAPDYRQTSLRLIFMSGDWIPVKLPERARRIFPSVEGISLGGATEGTVWSNYFPVAEVGQDWSSIPYGQPIDNNFFYILDAHRNPVPQGVVGELYIGGVGVADGYKNEAEKTAAAFVPDPFFPDYGGMMYRTGDLGRMLADGNMEFLGRRDHQVKIRGFRVELGEIESQLNAHPAIEKAMITTVGGEKNQRQIAAYFTSSQTEVTIAALHAHLGERLPEYMIPAYFIPLRDFPLNTNGKIDRRQLPDPSASMRVTEHFAEASTPLEKDLLVIWQDLLGLDRISTTDNFFQTGGNSLLAAQLVARIRTELELNLRLGLVFSHPTIQGLAEQLENLRIVLATQAKADDASDNELLI